MAKSLSEDAKAGMRKAMDDATQNPQKLPGVVFAVTDKTGQDLFSYASGTIGLDSGEPMTTDTVFWIASCTKMIGAIAAMQLVEQGKISLDDSAAVEKICPELAKMQVLKEVGKDGKPVMEAKKNGITLRMLLTHTAGFGYTFFNHEIRKLGLPVGTDEFSGQPQDVELLPLTFQPGTGWQYGTNIDWAGTIVARISGMSLNDYIQKNICAPLGLKNVNMFPTPEMKAKLAHMHQRDASGLRPRDHLNKRPLTCRQDEIKDIYNSAGAGAFAKPVEYVQILATLLNDGLSPKTHAQILKPETIAEMFKNQIPQFPNFGRQGITAARPDYTNPLGDLYPQGDVAQGWGLSAMITIEPGMTGRGANTMFWAGLPNLFWWCDREKGVAGMIASQILPFGDAELMGLWFALEGQVYAALK